ncbi:preprotein translocase subunit SecY [Ktedonosporobacter rubrisoli]|uniref:Protein translocase subunit SecY n=1 Tax=Ktedonosporobacter rubrisoli TaxID=2509675 RepID=A0A4P6JYI2_KTERU|nr:preprotein translocase subunit SecY [Ktedonosporobacter rubrisoli]QBD80106.1 preprotein translocase subunit SecY [Ktedonosporobacter rubrisoli]
MWERLRSIWKAPDLRNKILFTLGLLLVFRVLANITVPLTPDEHNALVQLFNTNKNGNLGQLLGLMDVFSGGSLQTFSIVAFGVYPYITATIVMQLLQPIIPALQNLSTQGEAGRLKFSQITRIITVPLAFLQALGQCAIYQKAGVLKNFSLIDPQYALNTWAIMFALIAGTMILVWLGELITEKGIGNGISLIIFGGIVSRIPQFVQQGYIAATSGGGSGSGVISIAVFLIIGLITIVGIVYIYQGQRRVPVQYPTKRQVGRGMLVGSAQTTYIPMQVNSAGMIPLIFAQSMLLFPAVISQYLTTSNVGWLKDISVWVATYLVNTQQWWYWALYFLLVVAFTYFYAYVMWQQQNIPENLQKQGAFIPGYRPGEPTSRYLSNILNRITLGGALFLGIVAILPFVARVGANQLLGSASLLIVVGVVLDTVRQLESQMVMRNYSGFLS